MKSDHSSIFTETSPKYHPLSFIDRATCPITFELDFYEKYKKWNLEERERLSQIKDSNNNILNSILSNETVLIEQMYSNRILSQNDPLFFILVNTLNQQRARVDNHSIQHLLSSFNIGISDNTQYEQLDDDFDYENAYVEDEEDEISVDNV
jgi:hypothetical protein